ncbi:MAG: hypothetical protein IT457_01155 [Planctomycetes bacterium]|nr:hypothetical protein [Planctomycetota bacterium]
MPRVLSALLALAVPLAAQTTWVVDVDNRPGAQFTELAAAVAAAAHGDTLLVRAGSRPYAPFATDKGLRIIGLSDPAIFARRFTPVVRVANLPAGETFVLDGFHVPPENSFEAVFTSNAGAIVLTRLRAIESCNCGPGVLLPAGFAFTDCAQVAIDACENFGKPAVDVVRSNVVITRSRLGVNEVGMGWGNCLHVNGGEVAVVESVLDASYAMDINGLAQPAVRLFAGALRVGASAATSVQGSSVTGMAHLQPAIEISGGSLELDGDVRLNPLYGGGVPLRILGGSFTLRQTPMVVARSAATASSLQVDALTTARAPLVVFAGLPIAPTAALPFGTLWLDPSASLVLAAGIAPANGIVGASLALPGGPPPGLVVAVQCVADLGAGLELSSPSLVALR